MLFRTALRVTLALTVACSSSKSSTSPEDAGGDSADPDAAVEAGAPEAGGDPTCGPPPYVNIGLVVRSASQSSADGGTPIEGATLTTSLCPGVSLTSAADGTMSAKVSKGAPFFPRFQATNYALTLIEEMQFDADKTGIVLPLPPSLFTALIPGFGPDKTAIIVGVTKNGGSGACDALDGVSFGVDGHPEARVTYFTNDAIPQPTSGTTTTVAGRAAITGVAAGPSVTVIGTKQGCTVTFAKAPYTGRIFLEAGALTLAPAYIGN